MYVRVCTRASVFCRLCCLDAELWVDQLTPGCAVSRRKLKSSRVTAWHGRHFKIRLSFPMWRSWSSMTLYFCLEVTGLCMMDRPATTWRALSRHLSLRTKLSVQSTMGLSALSALRALMESRSSLAKRCGWTTVNRASVCWHIPPAGGRVLKHGGGSSRQDASYCALSARGIQVRRSHYSRCGLCVIS